jgi:hypothetical protein
MIASLLLHSPQLIFHPNDISGTAQETTFVYDDLSQTMAFQYSVKNYKVLQGININFKVASNIK